MTIGKTHPTLVIVWRFLSRIHQYIRIHMNLQNWHIWTSNLDKCHAGNIHSHQYNKIHFLKQKYVSVHQFVKLRKQCNHLDIHQDKCMYNCLEDYHRLLGGHTGNFRLSRNHRIHWYLYKGWAAHHERTKNKCRSTKESIKINELIPVLHNPHRADRFLFQENLVHMNNHMNLNGYLSW